MSLVIDPITGRPRFWAAVSCSPQNPAARFATDRRDRRAGMATSEVARANRMGVLTAESSSLAGNFGPGCSWEGVVKLSPPVTPTDANGAWTACLNSLPGQQSSQCPSA